CIDVWTEREAAADPGPVALPVPLLLRGGDAHALGRAGLTVADEDVAGAVHVQRHEVVRLGREGDELPVAADRRLEARRVSLRPRARDADALGRPGLTVADEDVES